MSDSTTRSPYRCARNERCANRTRVGEPVPVTDETCPCGCHGQSLMNRRCDVDGSDGGGCGHLHDPPALDPDAPVVFQGGAILTESGLCGACTALVARALAELPLDYTELNLLLASGESGITDVLVSSSAELPIPIRVSVESLMASLVFEACSLAALVAEPLGVRWDVRHCRPGFRLSRAARLLTNALDTLIALPESPRRHHASGEWRDLDGIAGALELLRLHDLVRFAAGRTKLVHHLPSPCPRCERMTLIRHNGSDTVKCEACPASERAWWTEDEYRRLCLVLADDYRDELPRRQPSALRAVSEGTTGNPGDDIEDGRVVRAWPVLPMVEFPEVVA